MDIDILFLFLALILNSFHRIMHGVKNGIIYMLQLKNKNENFISKQEKNIHFIENLSYYSQFLSIFFLVFIFLNNYTNYENNHHLKNIIYSLFLSHLSLSVANYHRQKMINMGTGLPEEPKAEWFFGLWYKRPYGKWRILISLISFLLLIGILICISIL